MGMPSLARKIAAYVLPAVAGVALMAATSSHKLAYALPTSMSATAAAKGEAAANAAMPPQAIENPGFPPAYYYKPRSGRSMKPVFVYLHGRSGNPSEGCRDWAKVATEFGWVLCPSGQEERGGGLKGWGNDPVTSEKNVMGALLALRKKFGRRVQLYGNVLIGFSEGAFIAQNVGEREAKTFNRWLIIASCDRYFGDKTILEEAKKKLKRVYLWTGELDMVAPESTATFEHLKALKIPVKLNIPKGYWHAIPSDTMAQNFRKALRWLVSAK